MKRTLILILILSLLAALGGCAGLDGDDAPQVAATATLRAVGDIYLTDGMIDAARKSNGDYDFSAQFAAVVPLLAEADITLANFEGNFNAAPYGKETASYPDALAKTLAAAGIDLLQTANTYSIYGGIAAMERTKTVIESAGMTALGTYLDADDRAENQVVVREINGIRIAFVAFTKGFGGMGLPAGAESSVNLLYSDYTSNYEDVDSASVREVMEAARKTDADVIVAAVHWGSENTRKVSSSQEEIAELLIECGADVIIGSHSHLAGEIEQRAVRMESGLEKEVVIAYSLGDLSAVDENDYTVGLLLDLEITKDTDGSIRFSRVDYRAVGAVDRGETVHDRYRVLDIDAAIALYEASYYDRVDESLYASLTAYRERLDGYVHPEEDTES